MTIHLAPFGFDEFLKRIGDDEETLIRRLDELARGGQKETLEALCATWFQLLKTDTIQRWMLSGKWPLRARENDPSALQPVLELLLRRHLLHLETRRDPSRLSEFWRWATILVPKLADFWDRTRFDLTVSSATSTIEEHCQLVAREEASFLKLLKAADRALDNHKAYAALPWAKTVLTKLIHERQPMAGGQMQTATVKIVFATEQQHPLLRPGIVVTFRLLADADPAVFLKPVHVFDASFRRSMESALTRVGQTQLRAMEHDWGWLPEGFLRDTSGSLAIWLSQYLATGLDRVEASTLPPWLVMSATLDPDGPGLGGWAAPVGWIDAKLQTLVEEGIRVAYVAEAPTCPTDLASVVPCLVATEASKSWSTAATGKSAHPTSPHRDLICLPVPTVPGASFEPERAIVESLANEIRANGWLTDVVPFIKPSAAQPSTGEEGDMADAALRFLDFDPTLQWERDFEPPVYILDRLSQAMSAIIRERHGVLELVAPSTWGKSRLVYALRRGWCADKEISRRLIQARSASKCVSSEQSRDALAGASGLYGETPRSADGDALHPANWLVLTYSVVPGLLEAQGNFLKEIYDQAKQLPRIDGRGPLGDRDLPRPHDAKTQADARRELIALLTLVRHKCCQSKQPLVLAVDGVDELAAQRAALNDPTRPTVLDVLPRPHELPPGCFLLLTRRTGELPSGVREALDDVLDGRAYEDRQSNRPTPLALPRERVHAAVELSPTTDTAAQESVIRRFVSRSLERLWPGLLSFKQDGTGSSPPTSRRWSSASLRPEAVSTQPSDVLPSESLGESVATRHGTTDTRSVGTDASLPAADALIDAIVERSGSGFLNASLILDTLRWERDEDSSAPLPSPDSLPTAERIFPRALNALAERVKRLHHDSQLFEHWHLPVLGLVTVACEPITRVHLRCWLSTAERQRFVSGKALTEPPSYRPPTDAVWDDLANQRLHQTLTELGSFLRIDRSHDDHDQRPISPLHDELKAWLRGPAGVFAGDQYKPDARASGSSHEHARTRSRFGLVKTALEDHLDGLLHASHSTIITAAESEPWPDEDTPEDEAAKALNREPTRYHLLHTFRHHADLEDFAAAESWHTQHAGLAFRLGNWLWDQARFRPAIAVWNILHTQYARRIDQHGGEDAALQNHPTLVNDLARTRMNRGLTLWMQGEFARSVADYDESARLSRRLIDETFGGEDAAVQNHPTLVNDLAGTLMNRGNAWQSQGEFARSVADYDESARLRRRLIDETFGGEDAAVQNHPLLVEDLAMVWLNLSDATLEQDDPQAAIEFARRGLALLEKVVQRRDEEDVPPAWRLYISIGLDLLAQARREIGEIDAARSHAEEARQTFERLIAAVGGFDAAVVSHIDYVARWVQTMATWCEVRCDSEPGVARGAAAQALHWAARLPVTNRLGSLTAYLRLLRVWQTAAATDDAKQRQAGSLSHDEFPQRLADAVEWVLSALTSSFPPLVGRQRRMLQRLKAAWDDVPNRDQWLTDSTREAWNRVCAALDD